jgi:hypothetical protein
MRTPILVFVIITLLGCASPKVEETSGDSTVIANDSITQNVATQPVNYAPASYPPSLPSNFPGYSAELFTEDSTEAVVNEAVFELLNRYDTAELLSIQSSFAVTYQVSNDYDEGTSDATLNESENWYFDSDSAMQLRAYTHTWEESGSYSGMTIYIFDKEEIIAVYEDRDVTGQDTQISRYRAAFSKCPKCGIRSMNPNMGYGENSIDILDESYRELVSSKFWQEYNQLMAFLDATPGEFSGDQYVVQQDGAHGNTPFVVDYTIDEKLAYKFVTKDSDGD